jgi:outer membrane protein OmpA-like peptidoglycan-associated protein
MRKHTQRLLYVVFFTIVLNAAARAADAPQGGPPKQLTIDTSAEVPTGETTTWAGETTTRSEHLYPSIWGQVGVFRVRSGYSLPEGAISFGIGGEFYSVGNAPPLAGFPVSASTIAESLFLGYAPTQHLTLSVVRRNSSTTFNDGTGTTKLISSLGDFTVGGAYEFELSPSFSLSPLLNIMVASNFNNLAPSGQTVSGGLGAALTYNMYPAWQLPFFLHANLIYHSPQMNTAALASLQPEMFFQFSRYNTLTLGLGAEYHIGDFIPFVEYTNNGQLNAPVNFFSSPSRISTGVRFMPLNNKSLALLAGVDVGLGQNGIPGMPYTPPVQLIAQLSYTTGLLSSERKHYFTTGDVKVVNRKFIIRKNINFKVGSAILEPSSTTVLDQIADVILKNQVHKLLIVGHTDSSAPDDYNLKLSLDRANTVKTYLAGKGVAEETLMTQGYGKRKPRASNANESGRAKNRRVEFFILE